MNFKKGFFLDTSFTLFGVCHLFLYETNLLFLSLMIFLFKTTIRSTPIFFSLIKSTVCLTSMIFIAQFYHSFSMTFFSGKSVFIAFQISHLSNTHHFFLYKSNLLLLSPIVFIVKSFFLLSVQSPSFYSGQISYLLNTHFFHSIQVKSPICLIPISF